ncbi:MAG: hypothetical protein D6811_10130 [Alphaproteobacteria bacterium]|nr:MAG: hypothetical protein D6811_10130 [Alphaproteobacteria bacterium]
MRGTALLFMLTGIVFVLLGMVWGIEMSARSDFAMAPAHAHLNLIGFVMGAIFAIYFVLTPQADGGLAKALYALWAVTTVLMAIGIYMAVSQQGETLAKVASLLGVLTMLLFGWIVLKNGIGQAER